MKLSWKIYALLFAVILLSFALTLLLPTENILRYVYSSPAILGLLGILYRLFLDETQYQKNLALQHDQQTFDLGATTHMADVAFDKHVLFCEEYMKEMQSSVATLFREGPSPTGVSLASKLLQIRINHATWLTNDIDHNLEPFEKALRNIGAEAQYYKNDPAGANDNGAVKNMYSTFKKNLGLKENIDDSDVDPTIATSTIIKHLRDILKIEELTNLRHYLISSKKTEAIIIN
jgi:hypothetical protein